MCLHRCVGTEVNWNLAARFSLRRHDVTDCTMNSILWFPTWMESLSRARHLSSSFNARKLWYFIFPTVFLYWIEDDDFGFTSRFVLIPWTRWLITQYLQFQSVVHFNAYSCDEQSVHTVICHPWSGLLKRTAGRIQHFVSNSCICNRRQYKNPSY